MVDVLGGSGAGACLVNMFLQELKWQLEPSSADDALNLISTSRLGRKQKPLFPCSCS